jgi:hypothetical protein
MRILNNGNVGIGTTSPAHTLDVAGDGNFSGALSANGSQVYPGVFTGDSGSGGVAGAVPAPAPGDAATGKFLSAGGGWAAPGASIDHYPNSLLSLTWLATLTDMAYCHRVIYAFGYVWFCGIGARSRD